MAKLGIVSDEQFNKELLDSGSNGVTKPELVLPVSVQQIKKGRGIGSKEVPEGIRKLIGEESQLYGRDKALELAHDLGISDSSVSAYAKGATSTASYHEPDKGLSNYIALRKTRLTKKSLHKLNLALNGLTEEKLEHVKARDLAGIAKDMSVIANNMEPRTNNLPGESRPQFIVYAPQIRDERSYETLIVNDSY